jgi:TolB protein
MEDGVSSAVVYFKTCVISFVICATGVAFAEDAKVPESIVGAFSKADGNRDGLLSLDEYLVDRAPAQIAARDFRLFDLNSDNSLTVQEFWAIPSATAAQIRGPLPDPMQIPVDQMMAALDKSLANWQDNPKLEVDADGLAAALMQRFQKYEIHMEPGELDADENGKVSRSEARRFIEIQFGMRHHAGKLLHLPDGRVVNYTLFLHIDLNKNETLDKNEFVKRSGAEPNVAAAELANADADKSGSLSFGEWCQVPRGVSDPIMEFRQMDTNLDSFLDQKELIAGKSDWEQPIIASLFPAFDLNLDGKLSLAEYQLTMPANPVLPWQTPPVDSNGDGVLSFTEFRFGTTLFPLLRVTYFLRLDQNGSGSLEPDEFPFKQKVPDEFFVMNADGTGWKSLFKFEGHSACGSPAVSPDGKLLAFDAWVRGQQGTSAIYVMKIEGGDPEELCSGMMPSWSRDGTKLACSKSTPVYGSWLLDISAEVERHIGSGWGAQISPDGTKLAFTDDAVLRIYDFESETTKTILDGAAAGYDEIFWNVAWSPDGKRICFKGKKDRSQQVVTVNTSGDKPGLRVHHKGKFAVNADFAWHPTEDRVIYAMQCRERKLKQLYEFNPTNEKAPTLVEGQDITRNNTDACWTPDGKRLIVISGDY